MRLSETLPGPVAQTAGIDQARFRDWLAHPIGERVYRVSLDELHAGGPTGLCRTLIANDPGAIVFAGTTRSAQRTLVDAGAPGHDLEQAERWVCMPDRLIVLLDNADALKPGSIAPARLRRLQLPPTRCLVMTQNATTGPGRLVARGLSMAARA